MVETRSGTTVNPEEHPAVLSRGKVRGRGRMQGFSNAQLYTFLALAHGALALPLIFFSKASAKLIFGSAADPVEDQHVQMLQLYATGLLTVASMAYALEEAARGRMLNSFTADTLKLGLLGFTSAKAAEYLLYPMTKTPPAVLIEWLAIGATWMLPASHLLFTKTDRQRLNRDFVRTWRSHVSGLLKLRRYTFTAALYTLLTVAFFVAGAGYAFLPKFTMFHTFGYVYGKSTTMLWRALGVADMTLMPAITYTLREKSESNLLAKTIPRTLNLGLMVASVGHMLVLGPILSKGFGGFMLPSLAATWGTALLASMIGMAAPELNSLVEQVAHEARHEE